MGGFETFQGIMKCPSCGINQHPLIIGDTLICRHCGHHDDRSLWHGWRYGQSTAGKKDRSAYYKKYREEHREQIRANARKYYRTKGREKQRERYQRDKERIDAVSRIWRESHREQVNVASYAWANANPGKRKMTYLRRYRRLVANPHDPVHGTPFGYRLGCRCDGCRAAKREVDRAYRERKRAENG